MSYQKLHKKVIAISWNSSKGKPYLHTKTLLNLYSALFHSHLQYGLITTSSSFKTYLKKLSYTLQNKAVKIVGGKYPLVVEMVLFKKALFEFKFKMKILPDQFSTYLIEMSQVYEKFTRASYQNNCFFLFGIRQKLKDV